MARKPRYIPEKCDCCTQTIDYTIAIDRGSALIVLALYNAVRKFDRNKIHAVKEMTCDPKQFANYKDMIEGGYMSFRMMNNIARPRYHGLIAFAGKGSGEFLITPKGARFLRGEKIPRVAIIDKTTKHKKAYFNQHEDTITFTEALKKDIPFWDIDLPMLSRIVGDENPTDRMF